MNEIRITESKRANQNVNSLFARRGVTVSSGKSFAPCFHTANYNRHSVAEPKRPRSDVAKALTRR